MIGVDPSGNAAAAGVKAGDYLVSVGGLDVGSDDFGAAFNSKYAAMPPGGTIPVVIRRGTQQMPLNAKANFRTSEATRIVALRDASPKAVRIRDGILKGTR